MPKLPPLPKSEAASGNPSPDGGEGLFLCGQVLGRRRTERKTDKGIRYLITLAILAGGNAFQVDRWTDLRLPEDCPSTGDTVKLAVRVKSYIKNGAAISRLEWGDAGSSEEF